jgi:hypothetical protein
MLPTCLLAWHACLSSAYGMHHAHECIPVSLSDRPPSPGYLPQAAAQALAQAVAKGANAQAVAQAAANAVASVSDGAAASAARVPAS